MSELTPHLHLPLSLAEEYPYQSIQKFREALGLLDADALRQDAALQQTVEEWAKALTLEAEARTRDMALEAQARAIGLSAEASARAAALKQQAQECAAAVAELRQLVSQLSVIAAKKYEVGDFGDFPFAAPRPGWAVRNGAWLDSADVEYPDLWAYLHDTGEGRGRCVPLATWQSMSATAGGVGGVIWFSVDDAAKRIKLPDTRGDYKRDAGSSYLQAVGGWHADKGRNITGSPGITPPGGSLGYLRGAFYKNIPIGRAEAQIINNANGTGVMFDASREWGIEHTGGEFASRTYAMLGCVYVRRA